MTGGEAMLLRCFERQQEEVQIRDVPPNALPRGFEVPDSGVYVALVVVPQEEHSCP